MYLHLHPLIIEKLMEITTFFVSTKNSALHHDRFSVLPLHVSMWEESRESACLFRIFFLKLSFIIIAIGKACEGNYYFKSSVISIALRLYTTNTTCIPEVKWMVNYNSCPYFCASQWNFFDDFQVKVTAYKIP